MVHFKVVMRSLVVLLLALAAVSALPKQSSRIVGGHLTTIDQYPDNAVLLSDHFGLNRFLQTCGGVILNNRSIMTAAHCFMRVNAVVRWRTRLGSSYASTGGQIFHTAQIISHPWFNRMNLDNDIAIMRVQGTIRASNVIAYAAIPNTDYYVADNEVVWATGWGRTASVGPPSEQLRHVQIYTINLDICRQRYYAPFWGPTVEITDNMLCSGVLDVGGRDQCFGDSGGPLYHRGVVVGVCSFGPRNLCASPWYPGVNARVSRYTNWLVQNR